MHIHNHKALAHDTEHLYALDGFRALLAIWVYLGHLSNAVGYQNYVLGMHALAVDLFMVLSGFLMVQTWGRVLLSEQTTSARVLHFFKGRFFRIAPLYYFLLIICYLFLQPLTTMADSIQKVMPPPWAQGLVEYYPSAGWDFNSLNWLYLHITFLYGLVPGMVSSTPLPDWSLSLEMQFYLVFPLLFLLSIRCPLVLLATIAAFLCFLAPLYLGNYLSPGSIAHFGQPSVLPYRLNAFLAGMLIANLYSLQLAKALRLKKAVIILLSCAICVLPLTKPVILLYTVLILIILRKVPLIVSILSIRPLRLLGNISYSIYLVHLVAVIPITYWLFSVDGFLPLSPLNRFAIALSVSTPSVFLVSFFLFRYIEIPFINIGKRIAIK